MVEVDACLFSCRKPSEVSETFSLYCDFGVGLATYSQTAFVPLAIVHPHCNVLRPLAFMVSYLLDFRLKRVTFH